MPAVTTEKPKTKTVKKFAWEQVSSPVIVTMLEVAYEGKGQMDDARKLVEKASDYVKADFAGLLAQRAANPVERLQFVAEMVGHGGLGYGDGQRRFRELTAGLSPAG